MAMEVLGNRGDIILIRLEYLLAVLQVPALLEAHVKLCAIYINAPLRFRGREPEKRLEPLTS